jgi:hypothetical protein
MCAPRQQALEYCTPALFPPPPTHTHTHTHTHTCSADDSETMGQDNMRRQPEEGGQQPAEVVFTGRSGECSLHPTSWRLQRPHRSEASLS